MRVLYNEWDEPTAAWLRELINGRHLPSGSVDTRSIGDVRTDDLRDFDQCHFFAGIGGWPLALRWAGLEGTPGIWTGSPPCQPFSVAGKGLGQADDRHLAPVWLELIRECKPGLIFGEQVEAAIRVGWLDDLFDTLEGCGYACGAAVLPACSVGAPHIRKRLFFGAVRLEHANLQRVQPARDSTRASYPCRASQDGRMADAHEDRLRARREIQPVCSEHDAEHGGAACGLAHSHNTRPQGRAGMPERADEQSAGSGGAAIGLAHPSRERWRQAGCHTTGDREAHEKWARDRHSDGGADDLGRRLVRTSRTNPHHGFWSGADWLGCRDGKFRPVEPGTQPLATGISARVGRLRGYGNAIVPQVAAQFITEFLGAIADMQDEGLTP
ncbi:DNA cytosine methyltransferase [Asaia prunellae]|uniref:DNA cytosine methyltransferase n=1 Tax=Asaia prunellae TaxID=610245 RepID=UPI0004704AD4|nr:DNA cytosine methyltransferase [Asaia prunellae]